MKEKKCTSKKQKHSRPNLAAEDGCVGHGLGKRSSASRRRTTEPKWTADLLEKLRKKLGPAYTILKHSDRFTDNIPDFSASRMFGKTLWVEVKLLRKESCSLWRPKDWVDKPAQLHLTNKLGGLYLVHDPFREQTALFEAYGIRSEDESVKGYVVLWMRSHNPEAVRDEMAKTIEERV